MRESFSCCSAVEETSPFRANMSTQRSFSKGSPAPGPVPAGHIRLYSMRFCPFAHRARLVLNAKGIKFETINIHMKNKPDWFLERNPLGEVPTLETCDGHVIFESPITCDYLDEAYPENKLLPSSPYEKAQQKMMLDHFSKIMPYFYKISGGKTSGADVSGLESELKEKFTDLNQRLKKKQSKFFGGDYITMIDYMMWPWFERLEVFGVAHCVDGLPELNKWMECMMDDPAVKATMHSVDKHKTFFKSYVSGKPDYDFDL